MTKAAEPASLAATAAKNGSPFFEKGDGSALSVQTKSDPFFSKTSSAVQAKLTVNEPEDHFEKEADAVADKVVQKKPGDLPVHNTAPVSIQSKCSACAQEEEVQKKEEEKPEEGPKEVQLKQEAAMPDPPPAENNTNGNISSIQLKCAACAQEEEKVQKKPIFESDARADAMAGLQRKCTECAAEEKEEPATNDQRMLKDKEVQARLLPEASTMPVNGHLQTKPIFENVKNEAAHLPQNVQAKLTVNAPGDQYEKEADAVADKVVQRLAESATPSIQTKCATCEEEEVQKKEEPEDESVPEIQKMTSAATPDPPPPDEEKDKKLQRKCNAPLTGIQGIQAKPVFESGAPQMLQRRCRECEESDKVFLKPIGMVQLSKDSTSSNGSRESIIAAAKTKLGKIEAKHDDGGGKRVGATHLLEIFHLAAPGVWDDSIIETAGAQLPSWCGIFSVWAHKKAGKNVGNWQMGKGVSAFGTLTQTTSPQPGDIGYIDQPYQHHCIVVKIEGDNVHTIDGNSGLFSEVKENVRPRSTFTGFFTAFGGGSSVQKKEEEGQVQAKEASGGTASTSVETQLSSKSGGTSLPEPVREKMESSIGADFSGVKIHTDSSAVQMSKDLHAQAFTHGSDIYFNSGKFDPESTSGQHLLAHELTHTVQQGAAVQKKEVPQVQRDGDDPIGDSVSKVYDALDGWTDSDDSYIIYNEFQSYEKDNTDKIVSGVAAKAGLSIQKTYEWMQSDMVTSDWKNLFGHFMKVQAYRIDYLIAKQVYDNLDGYTSDSDSHEILDVYTGSSPVTGELIGKSLVQLEGLSGMTANDTSKYLFGDMTDLDAHKLSQYFFNSGDLYAVGYSSYWIASKVEDLLAGFTGMDDSGAIVKNFDRTPAELRSAVLYELDKICQARWSQTAAAALMEDMWQSDYEQLRTLMPGLLPVYNIEKTWYEWTWDKIMDGFDFLTSLIQYGICGLIGVVWGIVTVIIDVIVAIVDLGVALKNFVGFIIYYASGGKFCKEEFEKVDNFFTSMGKLFDAPGDAISAMWAELTLEASLIEGPFAACERAIFWTSRVINLLVNLALIFAWGYGAVKTALKGIEAIVELARAGELIAALKALPAKLAAFVKGLPGATAKAILTASSKVLELLKNPLEIINAARNTLTSIRMAAESEGYYKFLRQQLGKAVDKESKFWRERREFWKTKAETIEGEVGNSEKKLVTAVDETATDSGKAQVTINEAEAEANASKKKADELMSEVDGTRATEPKDPAHPEQPKDPVPGKDPKEPVDPKDPKEPVPGKDPKEPAPGEKPVPKKPLTLDERLPEAWREGSLARPARLKQLIPRMKELGYSDDVIVAIINNAYNHQDMFSGVFFSNLYDRILVNPDSKFVGGKGNVDKLVAGLASDGPNFFTARMLAARPNVNQSIVELLRVFSLEDVGALRGKFPAISDAQFIRDINGIIPRVNGTREDILKLLDEAGDMEKFNDALNRLGQEKYTPDQIRESFKFGEKLAKAISGSADDIAKAIWDDPNLEKLPDGRYKVSASKTGSKAGDQASRFIRARADSIAEMVLQGGSDIDTVRWETIKQAITNTDLPTIVKNDIIGEIWASTKVLQYRKLYGPENVIREVTLDILNAAGKPTKKKARLDAVIKQGNELLYKEFKASQTADLSTNQAEAYKYLSEGNAAMLRPTGANAETAFGGPDMPNFKAKAVDIERPPTK